MALRGRRIENFLELWWLVASGVVGIWVSSTSFQKSNIGWPQQPPTKKVVNFNMIFHESTKSIFFQNIKIKLNSRTWMTLKSSVEIFQTLEPLQPQWPPQPQQPPWPQWPLQPHFIKNITDCDGWIIPGTKMTNTGPFLGNGSSKIQFFTDISTISVGGCWGQGMTLFWKLVDEMQMPTTLEATSDHSSRKFSIFLPLRAI